MLHDLANADRFVIIGEQVENANTDRVGKGSEATGVLLRARLRDLGRLYLGQQLAVRHFVVAGTVVSTTKMSDNRATVPGCPLAG